MSYDNQHLTPDAVIKIMVRELGAIGQYYRNDWSQFDGRTLRYELAELSRWAMQDKIATEFSDFTDMLKNQESDL